MEMNKFAEAVVEKLLERVENCAVEIQRTTKNNGLILTGILIKPVNQESYISPNIYVDDLYHSYTEGNMTVEEAAEYVLETYHKYQQPSFGVDVKNISNWESTKDKVVFQLINATQNAEMLTQMPHKIWNDLAIIFKVLVNVAADGCATARITNALLKTWNCDIEELYQAAIKNTPKLLPYSLQTVNGILAELGIDDDDNDNAIASMYVLSNAKKANGAGVILYPDILKDFAKAIQGDFYILPSSIHEVILVPAMLNGIKRDAEELKTMVYEVNRTQVDAVEVLSDSVYKYCKDNGQVIMM